MPQFLDPFKPLLLPTLATLVAGILCWTSIAKLQFHSPKKPTLTLQILAKTLNEPVQILDQKPFQWHITCQTQAPIETLKALCALAPTYGFDIPTFSVAFEQTHYTLTATLTFLEGTQP
ncbi:MAG: hypothetical protein AB7F28_06410 [Candidatus Margulisiibacteriota bacterium]